MLAKKTVTVVIPTYNEEANIEKVYFRTQRALEGLGQYQLEFLFIDNCSTDRSREIIHKLADANPHVKAIFNAQNFGFTRSTFYGLSQAEGDCAVLMFADMQDPPEIIPQFLHEWELGNKIIVGIKSSSRENPLIYLARKMYYWIIRKISEVGHIDQFDGFGLYDSSFIKILRNLGDPLPYLRGIVAELGYCRKEVFYTQEKRQQGNSKFNFFKMYDQAMLGITSYSKVVMRIATLVGFGAAIVCFLIAIYTFIYKIFHWDTYPVGNAAIAVGVFFIGAVQLFFIGLLGEYILNINTRVLHRPLVIEEQRINFDKTVNREEDDQHAAE